MTDATPPPAVLVLGASGMLGRAVFKALTQLGHDKCRVVGTGHSRAVELGLEAVDVTDAAALSACLSRHRPRVVINCVAERRPDRVEQDEAHARRLNVELVERLAAAAAAAAGEQGFHLVHISTDYVFDGSAPPYAVDAAPNPLNAYGRHKLEAEEAVRKVRASIMLRYDIVAFNQPFDSRSNSFPIHHHLLINTRSRPRPAAGSSSASPCSSARAATSTSPPSPRWPGTCSTRASPRKWMTVRRASPRTRRTWAR